jgi:isoleucyl-tRNA synthetase
VLRHQEIIRDEVNVKAVEQEADADSLVDYRAKGLVSKLGPKLGPNAKAAVDEISRLKGEQVKEFKNLGKYAIQLPSGQFEIETGDVEITTFSKSGWMVKEEGGDLAALDITLTPELLAEGCARELVHGIQNLRKESGFEVSDRITVIYRTDPGLEAAIEQFKTYIMNETLALTLKTGLPESAGQQHQINGHPINLVIEQVKS